MRFIPTKFHAPLDYIVGAVLIAGPWIFQYSDDNAATVISIVLGVGLHRLQPAHELRARRLEGRADGRPQPHRHRRRRAARGLAVAPRLRRRRHELLAAFVVIGVAAIFLGLTTKQQGGYSYGKSSTPTSVGLEFCAAGGDPPRS